MQGRAGEVIERLKLENKELAELVDALKAALYAYGINYEDLKPDWAKSLTRQEQALMTMLLAAYPKAVSHWSLLEGLPGHDNVSDREVKLVAVVVHRCRKALGKDSIQSVHGVGYSLTNEGRVALAPIETLKQAA